MSASSVYIARILKERPTHTKGGAKVEIAKDGSSVTTRTGRAWNKRGYSVYVPCDYPTLFGWERVGRPKLPASERTRRTEARYQADKLAGNTISLLEEVVIETVSPNWTKKANRYPYDASWRSSELLVFSRACAWTDLNDEEKLELANIIPKLLEENDAIKFNGVALQSVRTIPHIHLLNGLITR